MLGTLKPELERLLTFHKFHPLQLHGPYSNVTGRKSSILYQSQIIQPSVAFRKHFWAHLGLLLLAAMLMTIRMVVDRETIFEGIVFFLIIETFLGICVTAYVHYKNSPAFSNLLNGLVLFEARRIASRNHERLRHPSSMVIWTCKLLFIFCIMENFFLPFTAVVFATPWNSIPSGMKAWIKYLFLFCKVDEGNCLMWLIQNKLFGWICSQLFHMTVWASVLVFALTNTSINILITSYFIYGALFIFSE